MRKLTVLCISISATGHVNATIGIGCALRKRGHRVVYAAERSYEGFYEKYGFEEKIYDEKENQDKVVSGREWRQFTIDNVKLINNTVVNSYQFLCDIFTRFIGCAKFCNARIEEIVKEVKPDLIIEDRVMLPIPALLASGVPIIKLVSLNPLFLIDDENVPPAFLGMPTNDDSEWDRHRKIYRASMKNNVDLSEQTK
ncbi:glycosyl transferase-like protein [Leptotrombidium deliense]|uniref:Glycosyl transferase-like protein n=1 Tax=Leptotrombidium deliense TaxID=299467 RepID=A0A443SJQ5_9ACAR|nr:glycosyl transferase-like protein [Leptotrombidium deliense]